MKKKRLIISSLILAVLFLPLLSRVVFRNESLPPPSSSENHTFSLIVGKWISNDDEKSSIEFVNGKKIDYYEGEKMSEGSYIIEKEEDFIRMTTHLGEEIFEYRILNLSDSTLILSHLPRGNTLSYSKEK